MMVNDQIFTGINELFERRSKAMPKAKVVLVGAAHTGKTSIVNRFIYSEFSPHTMPSTQPAFFQKKVNVNGEDYMLEIWDTAGQEQYHALSPMFYRDADAGIVVFDITDQLSFTKCKQWVAELRQARGNAITLVIAGNKSDLPSQRAVTLEAIAQFASSVGGESFETSAKTGENVELLFQSLVKALLKRPAGQAGGGSNARTKAAVRFDEAPKREDGCC
jgi:small GTP-binding protein